jgi:chaperonin cofactor prefoldin
VREELEVTNVKIDNLEKRFDAVDSQFRAVNERLDALGKI